MPPYKALIFDLDGTLIDSGPDIAVAANAGLVANGFPAQPADYIEGLIGRGARQLFRDILDGRAIAHDEGDVERIYNDYLQAYLDKPCAETRLFPHVHEDLAALRAAGIRLGICTNKAQGPTDAVLKALDLAPLFEVVIGGDVLPVFKPDPAHLLAVARRMEAPAEAWAYVGDTEVDRATAAAAGAPFFLVPWGGAPRVVAVGTPRLTRISDLLHMTAPRPVPAA